MPMMLTIMTAMPTHVLGFWQQPLPPQQLPILAHSLSRSADWPQPFQPDAAKIEGCKPVVLKRS